MQAIINTLRILVFGSALVCLTLDSIFLYYEDQAEQEATQAGVPKDRQNFPSKGPFIYGLFNEIIALGVGAYYIFTMEKHWNNTPTKAMILDYFISGLEAILWLIYAILKFTRDKDEDITKASAVYGLLIFILNIATIVLIYQWSQKLNLPPISLNLGVTHHMNFGPFGTSGSSNTTGGMTSPGMGMNNPGMGMNNPGMGMNNPGMGMNNPGYGMNNPGMGMNDPGVGVNISGFGMNSSGYGLNPSYGLDNSGAGANPGYGMNNPGYGMNNPGYGMNNPGVVMNTPISGVNNPGIGTNNPGVDPNNPMPVSNPGTNTADTYYNNVGSEVYNAPKDDNNAGTEG